MVNTKKLTKELVDLDETDWFLVLEEVQAKRREKAEAVELDEPGPNCTDAEAAQWIAQSHLSTDPTIRKAIYFPKGAPLKEIRLVEINVLLVLPDPKVFDAYDYSVDIEGSDFEVLIVDVTPEQWEAIQLKPKRLPKGWQLAGSEVIGRA